MLNEKPKIWRMNQITITIDSNKPVIQETEFEWNDSVIQELIQKETEFESPFSRCSRIIS